MTSICIPHIAPKDTCSNKKPWEHNVGGATCFFSWSESTGQITLDKIRTNDNDPALEEKIKKMWPTSAQRRYAENALDAIRAWVVSANEMLTKETTTR